MKRVLLSILAIVLMLKVSAQCDILRVTITPTNVDPNTCEVTFDLSYTVALNGGSKYSVVHLWQSEVYPAFGQSQYPLRTDQTGAMIGTIVIQDPATNPRLLTAWPTGSSTIKSGTTPSTRIISGDMDVITTPTGQIFNFTNLKAIVSNCNQAVTIKGDIWATQNGQTASCFDPGGIEVVVNEPGMRGFMNCSSPRSFVVSFNTTIEREITFSVYKDNGDGVFGSDDVASGKLDITKQGVMGSTTDVVITSPKKPINVYDQDNTFGYYSFSGQEPGSKFAIFVVARAEGFTYDNVLLIENTCAALPVSFSNFQAQRNKQTVSLKWETATEQSNRGFNVQRNTRGVWENIAFVFSAADGGNSNNLLSYAYNDPNNVKGVSQYRIQQVDMDGKASYSAIRSVKGEGLVSRTVVYPNPSQDGKVNVVFEDQAAKAVSVIDMSGRVVRQYRNVLNNLQIEGLESGMYSIQITDLSSAVSTTEKVIIKKR
jgi:hypothetical protein